MEDQEILLVVIIIRTNHHSDLLSELDFHEDSDFRVEGFRFAVFTVHGLGLSFVAFLVAMTVLAIIAVSIR